MKRPRPLVIASTRFGDHVPPPGHPESVGRAETMDVVVARWAAEGGPTAAPRPATVEELTRVHSAAYCRGLADSAGRALRLDPDTFTSPDSYDVARLAAGAAVEAARHAVGARMPVLALVRPPGHHAERGRAMGFCLFNSIAVAAADALDRGLDRIAIVDYDVHHGNGTQSVFYDDPRVLYVSTHQYPYYPGSGSADETGSADGLGFTLNAPFEAGATDGDYLAVFDRVIVPVLQEFRPRLVLVSAGFDAHRHDPLGGMRLSTTGYARLTRRLLQVAEDGADGAIALVTEGGYSLPALAACLEAVLSVLRGAPDDAEPPSPATHRAAETIDAIRAAHRGSWVMSL